MNLAEKRAQRRKLVEEMRTLNDACEGREWKADETEKYSRLEADVDKLDGEIKAGEEREGRAARLRELEQRTEVTREVPRPTAPPTPSDSNRAARPQASDAYRQVFDEYLSGGIRAAERRADTLQVGLLTKGGAMVGPEQFVNELLKGVDDDVFIRRHARRFRLESAVSLGVPTLVTDAEDFDWTAELATGSQTDIETGKRELRPHPMAKRVKVSKTLTRVSSFPVVQTLRERLQYKVDLTWEKAGLTGDGVQKPLGIYTASANGVDTSRDISTDNTATSITADGLINAQMHLKAPYWAGARWNFSRPALTQIRKLKTGDGQYLWVPGLTGGVGNSILGMPYDISEHTPQTFTTGLYVGALCNWQAGYWVVDALDMTIQFLPELYAESNTDGYIARMESDGQPVLAEAFVRVKLG